MDNLIEALIVEDVALVNIIKQSAETTSKPMSPEEFLKWLSHV